MRNVEFLTTSLSNNGQVSDHVQPSQSPAHGLRFSHEVNSQNFNDNPSTLLLERFSSMEKGWREVAKNTKRFHYETANFKMCGTQRFVFCWRFLTKMERWNNKYELKKCLTYTLWGNNLKKRQNAFHISLIFLRENCNWMTVTNLLSAGSRRFPWIWGKPWNRAYCLSTSQTM